jgi:hypothetical protein
MMLRGFTSAASRLHQNKMLSGDLLTRQQLFGQLPIRFQYQRRGILEILAASSSVSPWVLAGKTPGQRRTKTVVSPYD